MKPTMVKKGVRMAKERLPELIISDVMMPVKDGFACCREIRAQQETAHIPVLMLTARAEDVDILRGSRSGRLYDETLNMSQPTTLYRKVKQRSEESVIDMIRSISF